MSQTTLLPEVGQTPGVSGDDDSFLAVGDTDKATCIRTHDDGKYIEANGNFFGVFGTEPIHWEDTGEIPVDATINWVQFSVWHRYIQGQPDVYCNPTIIVRAYPFGTTKNIDYNEVDLNLIEHPFYLEWQTDEITTTPSNFGVGPWLRSYLFPTTGTGVGSICTWTVNVNSGTDVFPPSTPSYRIDHASLLVDWTASGPPPVEYDADVKPDSLVIVPDIDFSGTGTAIPVGGSVSLPDLDLSTTGTGSGHGSGGGSGGGGIPGLTGPDGKGGMNSASGDRWSLQRMDIKIRKEES